MFDVTLVGRRVTVFHNGVCIHNQLDLGASPESGPILLQGDYGKVSYRNLKIKPLSPDYVAKAKVYVLNCRSDSATIISVPEHEAVGNIHVGLYPHGIEADAAQTRLFISAEGEDYVNVIDLATEKVFKRIPVGPASNEVAATPDGRLLYVPSGATGTYEAVDVAQSKIVGKIKTGGFPHNVVCSTDGKFMYLSPVGDPHKIFVVETATHQMVGAVPLKADARPITISRDGKRLYVERNELNGFELVDVKSRTILYTVLFELTPEEQEVPGRPCPTHEIALTPDESELWACSILHEFVAVFDLSTEPPKQIARFPTRKDPHWLTFAPDGWYCYVSNSGSDIVQVVDVATHKTVKWIPTGKGAKRILAVTVPQF